MTRAQIQVYTWSDYSFSLCSSADGFLEALLGGDGKGGEGRRGCLDSFGTFDFVCAESFFFSFFGWRARLWTEQLLRGGTETGGRGRCLMMR